MRGRRCGSSEVVLLRPIKQVASLTVRNAHNREYAV